MATIKRELVFIHEMLVQNSNFGIKLDAWRCTLIINGNLKGLVMDGADMFPLTWQVGASPAQLFNTWTVAMGGMIVNGQPVLMDDEIQFVGTKDFTAPEPNTPFPFSIVLVKEYYVEGRPGPDKTLSNEVPRAIPGSTKRPTGAGSSRPAGFDRNSRRFGERKVRR